MHRFEARWDRPLLVTTSLAVLVLGALIFLLPGIGLLTDQPEGAPAALRLIPIGLLAILALTWSLAPRGYAIGEGELRLERRLGATRIPLSRVSAVGALASLPRRGLLRYLGTSGLFGHFGRYWSPALGRFRLHATRCTGLVIVDTEDGRWVLSPEPPAAFVTALRRAAPRAAEASADGAEAGRGGAGLLVAGVLGAVALLVSGIFVAITGLAPVAARVTDEAVVVERRWFGDVVLPLAEVRRAEPLAAGERRGWVRTAGTAVPGGAAWGRFSSPVLGAFQLYAWRPGPMVRLDTASGPVVLTPEDPAGFLEEVRARLPRAP